MLSTQKKEAGWTFMEEFIQNEHNICIEFLEGETNTPTVYRVLYKNQWELLLGELPDKPTSDVIASAIRTLDMDSKGMKAVAKANLLQGFFMRIKDLSAIRGYCMVCGLTAKSTGSKHDDNCALGQALKVLSK